MPWRPALPDRCERGLRPAQSRDVVENVTNEEADPAHEGENRGQHRADEIALGDERWPPVVPIGGKEREAERERVLLELEAHRGLVPVLRHEDVVSGELVVRVDDHAEHKRHDIKSYDGGAIISRRDGARAVKE